jgi:large subunit ribosomal protein L6
MSRIGKKPIEIPSGVTIGVADRVVSVEGTKGKLTYTHRPEIDVAIDGSTVNVTRSGEDRTSRELHGLTRALVANMVEGVANGFEKKLEIVGVGYLASISGDTLQLRVGYANELHRKIPEGLTVTCPDQTHIVVQGCDKGKVTQFAAEIRSLRKPEPYKGKGIRYQGEHVKIKPGKSATK